MVALGGRRSRTSAGSAEGADLAPSDGAPGDARAGPPLP